MNSKVSSARYKDLDAFLAAACAQDRLSDEECRELLERAQRQIRESEKSSRLRPLLRVGVSLGVATMVAAAAMMIWLLPPRPLGHETPGRPIAQAPSARQRPSSVPRGPGQITTLRGWGRYLPPEPFSTAVVREVDGRELFTGDHRGIPELWVVHAPRTVTVIPIGTTFEFESGPRDSTATVWVREGAVLVLCHSIPYRVSAVVLGAGESGTFPGPRCGSEADEAVTLYQAAQRIHEENPRDASAAAILDRFRRLYPRHSLFASATLLLGRVLCDQGRDRESRDLLDQAAQVEHLREAAQAWRCGVPEGNR